MCARPRTQAYSTYACLYESPGGTVLSSVSKMVFSFFFSRQTQRVFFELEILISHHIILLVQLLFSGLIASSSRICEKEVIFQHT